MYVVQTGDRGLVRGAFEGTTLIDQSALESQSVKAPPRAILGGYFALEQLNKGYGPMAYGYALAQESGCSLRVISFDVAPCALWGLGLGVCLICMREHT